MEAKVRCDGVGVRFGAGVRHGESPCEKSKRVRNVLCARRERIRGQRRLSDHICVSEISLIDGDKPTGLIGVLRILRLGRDRAGLGGHLRLEASGG